jgi:hypothetical protein
MRLFIVDRAPSDKNPEQYQNSMEGQTFSLNSNDFFS